MTSQLARRGAVLLAALLLLAPSGASAKKDPKQELVPQYEGAALVEQVRAGGTVILLRHASTASSGNDPQAAVIGDCSTQRNLNARGKQQAQEMGRAFKKLGIQVGDVLSSPYCRCVQTAKLAFGKAQETDLLGLALYQTSDDKIDRGAEVRKLLDTAPAPGKTNVLVTHTVNLMYAFGLNPRPEGVAHVFRPTGFGRPSYLGKLTPEDWVAAAAAGG